MEVQHLFSNYGPNPLSFIRLLRLPMYVEVWLHISPAAWPQGSFMTSHVPAVVLSSMREEQTTQNKEIQIKNIKQTVKSCI